MSTEPRLYSDLAPWWPLLSAPEDYAEEAALYLAVLRDRARRPLRRVLELGCGGGNNASHMKAHAELTLVDLSPQMLEVSRALNPECRHVEGDMRTVRLDEVFDAVFVHDAIDYMTSEDDLVAAMATAAAHLEPGGIVLLCPDHVAENFEPRTDHGGHDSPDGSRGLRYLEWTRDNDPTDDVYVTDYAYLVREGDSIEVVHERHEGGLFPTATWLRLLGEAGLEGAEPVSLEGSDWATVGFTALAPA